MQNFFDFGQIVRVIFCILCMTKPFRRTSPRLPLVLLRDQIMTVLILAINFNDLTKIHTPAGKLFDDVNVRTVVS